MRSYLYLTIFYPIFICIQPFTIMLGPAGNLHYPGRAVGDSYECGVSLQCAQELQKMLDNNRGIRCIIARSQTEQDLEIAQFANRLDIDFYVSLNFFYKANEKPCIYLYHFLVDPVTDFWQPAGTQKFSLVEYNQAHKQHISVTKKYVDHIHRNLKDALAKHIIIEPPYGLPFKPLVGITAPACALEIVISQDHTWQEYVPYIASSLTTLISDI